MRYSGSKVKNPPANAGDVGSIPGSGRSPAEEMATHSSILAWKIPWTEEPGGSPWGHKELDMTQRLTLAFYGSEEVIVVLLVAGNEVGRIGRAPVGFSCGVMDIV